MSAWDYTVVRSNRRTLALEITDDARLLVRAPKSMPRGEIERALERHSRWISSHLERQRRHVSANPEPTQEELEGLIALARSVIPPRVKHYAAIMGVEPAGVRITGAKKRFGSCSAKNSLCFSYRLVRYPEEAVDYVVVHELAHIRHKNHGRDFYRLVESVLPDYRQRRKLLKA